METKFKMYFDSASYVTVFEQDFLVCGLIEKNLAYAFGCVKTATISSGSADHISDCLRFRKYKAVIRLREWSIKGRSRFKDLIRLENFPFCKLITFSNTTQ